MHLKQLLWVEVLQGSLLGINAREGMPVTVFEKSRQLGAFVARLYQISNFYGICSKDVQLAEFMGLNSLGQGRHHWRN